MLQLLLLLFQLAQGSLGFWQQPGLMYGPFRYAPLCALVDLYPLQCRTWVECGACLRNVMVRDVFCACGCACALQGGGQRGCGSPDVELTLRPLPPLATTEAAVSSTSPPTASPATTQRPPEPLECPGAWNVSTELPSFLRFQWAVLDVESDATGEKMPRTKNIAVAPLAHWMVLGMLFAASDVRGEFEWDEGLTEGWPGRRRQVVAHMHHVAKTLNKDGVISDNSFSVMDEELEVGDETKRVWRQCFLAQEEDFGARGGKRDDGRLKELGSGKRDGSLDKEAKRSKRQPRSSSQLRLASAVSWARGSLPKVFTGPAADSLDDLFYTQGHLKARTLRYRVYRLRGTLLRLPPAPGLFRGNFLKAKILILEAGQSRLLLWLPFFVEGGYDLPVLSHFELAVLNNAQFFQDAIEGAEKEEQEAEIILRIPAKMDILGRPEAVLPQMAAFEDPDKAFLINRTLLHPKAANGLRRSATFKMDHGEGSMSLRGSAELNLKRRVRRRRRRFHTAMAGGWAAGPQRDDYVSNLDFDTAYEEDGEVGLVWPFGFAVQHKATRAILVAGAVYHPDDAA